MDSASPPSLRQGRLCIAAAAILWSLSGGFTKLLTQPTGLRLNSPAIGILTIACYRVLFAGLVLVPTLRRRDLSFRPAMVPMVICFAVMNVLFIWAMSSGTAADAILLQYTAPMWMYLASIWLLGEPPDRRSWAALILGLAGIAVILAGGWQTARGSVVAAALGSGITYAGVMLFLRVLRDASSRWLTVQNLLISGFILIPQVWRLAWPSLPQLGVLFLFGAVQLGLPYWLVARGLRSVSPQEAGVITLLEPVLSPVWAYAVAGERPATATVAGGVLILGALLWRYWPLRVGAGMAPARAKPDANRSL